MLICYAKGLGMPGESERQATIRWGSRRMAVTQDHLLRQIKPPGGLCLAMDVVPVRAALCGQPATLDPKLAPAQVEPAECLECLLHGPLGAQPCEQLRYNLLLKWFLDLNIEDEPFHPTTFTKNRERLLLKEVVREARRQRLHSTEHFTVDGTLLEA